MRRYLWIEQRNLSFQDIFLFMVFYFSNILGLVMVPSDAHSSLPLYGFSSSKSPNTWISRRISCSHRGTLLLSPSTIVLRGGGETNKENENESFSIFLEEFARDMEEMRKDLLDETRLEMEQLKLEILEEKRRRRQQQEKEEDEKNPIVPGSLTSTDDIQPVNGVELDFSAKAEVFGNGDVGDLQETAAENHDDDFAENKEEIIDYGEEEVINFNLTESEDKSLLEEDDAAHSDNKRRGQVLVNEYHDQDSINEAPTTEELVQSEDDEFSNELDDGWKSSEILNHKQQRRPDTGEILDAEEYTTEDGEAQHDEEELLKLQSNMERKEHKKTKKIVSKSIKATSTPMIFSKERQSDDKGNHNEALSSTKIVSNLPQNRVVWMATMSRAVRVMGLVAIYIYMYINLLQALPPNSKTRFVVLALLTAFFHFQISKQFGHK
jgi:hypothetical protein